MNVQRLGIGIFLFVLVGFVVFSIVYAIIRLQSHQEFVNGQYAKRDNTENTEGRNITLTESKNGQRKWEVKVQRIRYNSANTSAVLNGVEGVLFSDDGKIMLTFKSPEGVYDKLKSRFDLSKQVMLDSPTSGIKIQAPSMTWISTANQIVASGGIRMSKKGFGLSTAKNAFFALDMSKVELSGGAVSMIGQDPPNT